MFNQYVLVIVMPSDVKNMNSEWFYVTLESDKATGEGIGFTTDKAGPRQQTGTSVVVSVTAPSVMISYDNE